MVNFGPLAAEIISLVWGTPANFNGFCVLASLLHGTLVVGVILMAVFHVNLVRWFSFSYLPPLVPKEKPLEISGTDRHFNKLDVLLVSQPTVSKE